MSYSKSFVFEINVSCSDEKENKKTAFSNSYGLKSFLEKFRFRDDSPNNRINIKLRFQVSPA